MSFRILMTADTVGGVWVYALELARGLEKKGVEVIMALMGGHMSPSQKQEAAEIPGLRVFESDYKLEWMETPWHDVEQAGDWLLELETCFRPDIIHLNGFAHGPLPWKAPVFMVGHSCVLSWWQAVKKTPLPGQWSIYESRVRNGLMSADMIAAPSQAMLDNLHGHYGPLPNGRVILNGRDPDCFFPGAKEQFIITAGRLWDEAKNIRVLARAARNTDWPVCVAGETRYPDMGISSENAQTAHLSGDFTDLHQIGYVSQPLMAKWLSRASVYVSPALYEPFGLTVLEAALSGCALVLSDIPSLRELWEGAALFANPESPEEFAAALNKMAGNAAYRQKMAAFARKRALEAYTPGRMADEYLACYMELAGARETVFTKPCSTGASRWTETA